MTWMSPEFPRCLSRCASASASPARIAAPPQTVAQKSSVDVARRRDRAAADRAYRGLVDVRALDAGLGGEVRRELGEQIGVTLLRRDLAAIRVGEADGRVGIHVHEGERARRACDAGKSKNGAGDTAVAEKKGPSSHLSAGHAVLPPCAKSFMTLHESTANRYARTVHLSSIATDVTER